jgi:predicted metal-dependent HD superfamily phosphohydrolase
MPLQAAFLECCQKYTDNARLPDRFWREIASRYSENGRHYHTLTHLEQMRLALNPVRDALHDREAVLFALCYHDIVYDPRSDRNEAQSAELAATRLAEIAFPEPRITHVIQMILATQHHAASEDHDTNSFMDADLSGLGTSREEYRVSSTRVRQEYSVYPDAVYNAGRQHVIQHFLSMPRIFKTRYFYERFERQARENLKDELKKTGQPPDVSAPAT